MTRHRPPPPSSDHSTAASPRRRRSGSRPPTRGCFGGTAHSRSSGSTTAIRSRWPITWTGWSCLEASLRIEVPRTLLEAEIAELLDARGGSAFDGALRIVLTRGGLRLLLTEPALEKPGTVRLATVTYAPTRILDGVKSLSYAANMLATRLAQERGFDEALLVTPHGRVLEAPTSSIFWIDAEGRILTPPLSDHILASITRRLVMEAVEVEERPCTMDDLRAASQAFLASTTREAQSIIAVDDLELPVGERTLEVQRALRARIRDELGT